DVKYGDVIARAKAYIYENYGDSLLSLNTVAAYTGFSPNHFSSIFSQNTGETFIGFLTRVRMEQAKKLLLETEMRSAEVAFQVGYNDVNYFRFLFKKHTGMSARDLRSIQGREDG
ncbi:MAG: AraC family transcriptional regulator, partial [Bacillota bacterium]